MPNLIAIDPTTAEIYSRRYNWVLPKKGGAGSPSNTLSPGSRPTSVPSGILIHPAVWPQ